MDGFLQGLGGYLGASPILAFMAVFLGGVLTSFTPCVYPMIPITIAYIGGRSGDSKLHGLSLSLFYVLGMAVTYAALGRVCGLDRAVLWVSQHKPHTLYCCSQYIYLSRLVNVGCLYTANSLFFG